MFRVDRQKKALTQIPKATLTEAKILECQDLQEYIASCFESVVEEMDEPDLKLIGREVMPSSVVADRIDLLAVDEDCAVVVIELKRAKHKFQLIQALSYAAMISKLEKDEISSRVSEKKLVDELDLSTFNNSQRVILIAEDFDYEVLATCEWLDERNIKIKCVRVSLSKDALGEYLNFSVVFPPKEIEDEAKIRGAKTARAVPVGDWQSILGTTRNPAVKVFFERYLEAGQENRAAYRSLHFRIDGARIFEVGIKAESAYVEQKRRFQGDQEFWQQKLGETAEVHEVYGGRRLRFRLITSQDFAAFSNAIESQLKGKVWEPVKPVPASDTPSPVVLEE